MTQIDTEVDWTMEYNKPNHPSQVKIGMENLNFIMMNSASTICVVYNEWSVSDTLHVNM